MTNFIGVYKIKKKVCDDLILLFNNQKDLHQQGTINERIQKEKKQSTELVINPNDFESNNAGFNYFKELKKCLNKYKKEFDESDKGIRPYSVRENVKIQYYKPGEGFWNYHKENGGHKADIKRHLVFMTYLNDVTDKGGTQFKYQKKTFRAKKGDTLIWPSIWTHTHRGVVSKTQEKYIITGWYTFNE